MTDPRGESQQQIKLRALRQQAKVGQDWGACHWRNSPPMGEATRQVLDTGSQGRETRQGPCATLGREDRGPAALEDFLGDGTIL